MIGPCGFSVSVFFWNDDDDDDDDDAAAADAAADGDSSEVAARLTISTKASSI